MAEDTIGKRLGESWSAYMHRREIEERHEYAKASIDPDTGSYVSIWHNPDWRRPPRYDPATLNFMDGGGIREGRWSYRVIIERPGVLKGEAPTMRLSLQLSYADLRRLQADIEKTLAYWFGEEPPDASGT